MFFCLDVMEPALVVDAWLTLERLSLKSHHDSDFPATLKSLIDALEEAQAKLNTAGYNLPSWVFNVKLIAILDKHFPKFITNRFPVEPTIVDHNDANCMSLSSLQEVFLSIHQEERQERLREAEAGVGAMQVGIVENPRRGAQRQRRKARTKERKKAQQDKKPSEIVPRVKIEDIKRQKRGRSKLEKTPRKTCCASSARNIISKVASTNASQSGIGAGDDHLTEISTRSRTDSTKWATARQCLPEQSTSTVDAMIATAGLPIPIEGIDGLDPYNFDFDDFLTPMDYAPIPESLCTYDIS